MVKAFTSQGLKEVLMDPTSSKIKEPYYLIDGVNNGHITIISTGKNGDEYNKTYGGVQSMPTVLSIHCLFGQGILLMQRQDYNGDAKEVKVVYLRPGTTTEVPAGFVYCFVNTGSNYLVILDNYIDSNRSSVVDNVKAKRGLSYYIVEKRGEISFEKNPQYTFHPQIGMD